MYLVIETCDRTLSDIKPVKDHADAIRTANELLEHHVCEELERRDVWDEYAGSKARRREGALEMQIANPAAGDVDAWSNLCDQAYDAFIRYIGPETERQLLTLLLKDMCQRRMDENNSECGDGACDECPINQILTMIQAAPAEPKE